MVMAGRQRRDEHRADCAYRDGKGLRFAIREGGRTVGRGQSVKLSNRFWNFRSQIVI